MKTKTKTVYILRIRPSDADAWGEPGCYRTRKERDEAARYARILCGLRTWSYEEKKTPGEAEALTA